MDNHNNTKLNKINYTLIFMRCSSCFCVQGGNSDWKNISVKDEKGLPYHLNSECQVSSQAEKFLKGMLSKQNEIARLVDSA